MPLVNLPCATGMRSALVECLGDLVHALVSSFACRELGCPSRREGSVSVIPFSGLVVEVVRSCVFLNSEFPTNLFEVVFLF